MSEYIQTERLGAVLLLRLDRPEKKNALTQEMYAALAEGLRAAEEDSGTRVVLFSGAGDAFTGGNDLRDFLERPPTDETSPVMAFLNALAGSTRPLVAAVHGMAVGIGTTLLLHCDLVYAARSARFHLPFVQLGLVPEAGSSLLLPRRIGSARAAEMLLLGEPMGAEEALAAGLVSRVFSEDELMEEVLARAERLARLPPEAVRATRALLRREDHDALPQRMREEADLFLERLGSEEARAAMQAFFGQRKG